MRRNITLSYHRPLGSSESQYPRVDAKLPRFWGRRTQNSFRPNWQPLTSLLHVVLFFSRLIPSPWTETESLMPEALLRRKRWADIGSLSSLGPGYVNNCSTQLSTQIQVLESRSLQSVDVDGHIPGGTCPYNDLVLSGSLEPEEP